jgi:hypothetical protein
MLRAAVFKGEGRLHEAAMVPIAAANIKIRRFCQKSKKPARLKGLWSSNSILNSELEDRNNSCYLAIRISHEKGPPGNQANIFHRHAEARFLGLYEPSMKAEARVSTKDGSLRPPD